jgi:hypothetical protein
MLLAWPVLLSTKCGVRGPNHHASHESFSEDACVRVKRAFIVRVVAPGTLAVPSMKGAGMPVSCVLCVCVPLCCRLLTGLRS